MPLDEPMYLRSESAIGSLGGNRFWWEDGFFAEDCAMNGLFHFLKGDEKNNGGEIASALASCEGHEKMNERRREGRWEGEGM